MIFLLEIPHQFLPRVSVFANEEQLLNALARDISRTGETVYEKISGRNILEEHGYTSADEMRNDLEGTLADLIDKHGLDVPFYWGYGRDDYSVEPMDEWQTFLDWNASDLHAQRVYMNDNEVVTALADDAEWRIHQGIKARSALESALVES